MDVPTTSHPRPFWPHTWKQAAFVAIVLVLLLEFVLNLFARQTLWHRIEALEERVSHLERIHEQDDLLRKERELQDYERNLQKK